ncbi:MAG: CehA/McbA family metallohydrolase, partial [Victivallales bacterium]|nr:CehA/McbA family metallohydrolase [Victivallales bacterium]
MSHPVQYYGRHLMAYRASLHTHSTVSDGSFTPAEVIAMYAERGYDILAFTDHSATNPVSTYDPKGLTLISGMEIHPQGPRGERWHLLALGIPEDFPNPVTGAETTMQQCINAVREAGGIPFCAHPAFCGFHSEDLASLEGLAGLEVFNSDCRFAGKGSSEHIWNELADQNILLNAIAVDDMHARMDFGCNWTMLLVEKTLSPQAILNALRNGDFYATQGPQIYFIDFHDGVLE